MLFVLWQTPSVETPVISDKRFIGPDTLEKLRTSIIALFANGQYHEVGIRSICVRAGVSPQTVYKYYGEKEQLLLACMERDLAGLLSACQQAAERAGTPFAALKNLSEAYFEFLNDNPLIARIIYLNMPAIYWSNRSSPSRETLAEFIRSLFQQGIDCGELRPVASIDIVVDIFSGSANRIVSRWLVSGQTDNLLHMGRHGFDMVMLGLKN